MPTNIGRKKRTHRRRTRSVNRSFVIPPTTKPSLSDQASRTTSEVELIPNEASDSIRALAEAAAMMTTAEGSRGKGKEILDMDVDTQPPPQPRPTFDLNHTPGELAGSSNGQTVTLENLIENANRTLAISLANSHLVPPPLALGQIQHTPGHPFSVVNPYIPPSTDPTIMMLNAYGVPVPYVPPQPTYDRPNPHFTPSHVSVTPPATVSVARATAVPMTTIPRLNPIPPIRHVYNRRSSTARNPTPPAPNPISWAPPSVPRSSSTTQTSRHTREEVRLSTLLSNETAFLRFSVYMNKLAHSPKGFLEDTVSRLSNIKKVITAHDWDILCAVPTQYNLSWVREFYTEASIRKEQQIPVRGILVDYSPASIHALLGTRPHTNSKLDVLRKNLSKDDLDDILLTLTIPGSDWYFEDQVRHLRIKSLTNEANVWAQFIKHTLCPTGHNSKLGIDRVLLLYCIVKQYPFDVGVLISNNIKTSCVRINCRLLYPTIIHGLMAKAQVWIFPTDIFPKEKMVLGRKVLGKLLRSCPSKATANSPPTPCIPTPKDHAHTEQFVANPSFKLQDIRELFRMHHNHQRTLSWISRVLFEFRSYDVHRDRIWRDTVRVLNRDLLYGLPSYPTLPPLEPMLHPPTHRHFWRKVEPVSWADFVDFFCGASHQSWAGAWKLGCRGFGSTMGRSKNDSNWRFILGPKMVVVDGGRKKYYKSKVGVSATNSVIYVKCAQLYFTSMTPYELNVNSLFRSLVDSAYISKFKNFEVSTPGSSQNDVVNGLFQCQEDLSYSDCKDCVESSVSQLKTSCFMSIGGTIQLDECFVKYDNTSFFGVVDEIQAFQRCAPSNGYNLGNMTQLDDALTYLINVKGQYFHGSWYGSVQDKDGPQHDNRGVSKIIVPWIYYVLTFIGGGGLSTVYFKRVEEKKKDIKKREEGVGGGLLPTGDRVLETEHHQAEIGEFTNWSQGPVLPLLKNQTHLPTTTTTTTAAGGTTTTSIAAKPPPSPPSQPPSPPPPPHPPSPPSQPPSPPPHPPSTETPIDCDCCNPSPPPPQITFNSAIKPPFSSRPIEIHITKPPFRLGTLLLLFLSLSDVKLGVFSTTTATISTTTATISTKPPPHPPPPSPFLWACASDSSPSLTKINNNNKRSNLLLPSIKSTASDSTAIVDGPTQASTSEEGEEEEIPAKIGARVRVTVPEVELNGKEGKVKEYVALWKGKHISATFPYKIEFLGYGGGVDGDVAGTR
ncbi:hypothetical protein OSB04_018301 [Centaurea solstitialis]|uniref:Gnk2-homologous domain-containing protein n=1 Tax=Centaurea solstitialis TaxID=347529 RepID=A0AA38WMV1_9ASTR|nr:hypothetical protein OSB04_018301 [Centaurea solstitialis]